MARASIAGLTTPRDNKRGRKVAVTQPAQAAAPFQRRPISFAILDSVGHGVAGNEPRSGSFNDQRGNALSSQSPSIQPPPQLYAQPVYGSVQQQMYPGSGQQQQQQVATTNSNIYAAPSAAPQAPRAPQAPQAPRAPQAPTAPYATNSSPSQQQQQQQQQQVLVAAPPPPPPPAQLFQPPPEPPLFFGKRPYSCHVIPPATVSHCNHGLVSVAFKLPRSGSRNFLPTLRRRAYPPPVYR